VHRFLTHSRVAAVTAALLLATIELSAQSAKCRGGSLSYSATHGGTCSGHEGVESWIQRRPAARHAFARQTGFPNGRPGYIVDHMIPVACGGANAPRNMQWQTLAAATLKDKTERAGC